MLNCRYDATMPCMSLTCWVWSNTDSRVVIMQHLQSLAQWTHWSTAENWFSAGCKMSQHGSKRKTMRRNYKAILKIRLLGFLFSELKSVFESFYVKYLSYLKCILSLWCETVACTQELQAQVPTGYYIKHANYISQGSRETLHLQHLKKYPSCWFFLPMKAL